ncbi:MAG: argininosuccinate lyase [Chloroflexota bacterium]
MTLWGGAFASGPDPLAWALNASLSFDQRLAQQDVQGSLAWAAALGQAGVLLPEEQASIEQGLHAIAAEFAAGSFSYQPSDEDIHTAVERRLGELIGPLAGKLHTGRSRNDQVATDFRLWLLGAIPQLGAALGGLQQALVGRAEADMGVLMPGYTHTQRAQPLLLSHWWLAHFWPLQRDQERLAQLAVRCGVLPLGAGALAGTAFPVDRAALAQALGFHSPAPNSIDAVSDRDFAAEFLFCSALAGVHLSRLAEALILFSTREFGYFELDEAYASGSSLMPQKKNPDVFELARGKAGALIGLLCGLLSTLKGLPGAYDKDLQEDKLPVFQAFDALVQLLPVLAGALGSLKVHPGRLRAAIDSGMLATDLADYLVQQGIPFREAHGLAGRAVRRAAQAGLSLEQLPLEDYQQLHAAITEDVYRVFDPEASLARRSVTGGTAPQAVAAQLQQAQALLAEQA